MSQSAATVKPHLSDMAPNRQQSCILKSCKKCEILVTQKPLMLSKFLHSTVPNFIHAHFIYGHWHACVNGCRTSGVIYTSSWRSSTLNVYIQIANGWYGRAQSKNALVALHDTPVCLCHGQLALPHSHVVPLLGLPFLNTVTNKISVHEMHMHSQTPAPSDGNIYICHMLHSLYQPSWAGGRSHDLWTALVCVCMSICICVTFHVGAHLKDWYTERTRRGGSYEKGTKGSFCKAKQS
jgi:hypothetical protein